MGRKTHFLLLLCILFGIMDIQAQDASYFRGGKLYLVNSSHQDIAWMDSLDECIRFRDEQMITPALQRMAESASYCFSVEEKTLMLDE